MKLIEKLIDLFNIKPHNIELQYFDYKIYEKAFKKKRKWMKINNIVSISTPKIVLLKHRQPIQ